MKNNTLYGKFIIYVIPLTTIEDKKSAGGVFLAGDIVSWYNPCALGISLAVGQRTLDP